MTTFRNPLTDPLGTRRGPPLVSGPQFENRFSTHSNTDHTISENLLKVNNCETNTQLSPIYL